MRRILTSSCVFLAAMLAFVAPAKADVIATGTSGTLSATADFNISGNTLTITLTNTDTTADYDPASTLSGLFWDLTNFSGTLTAVSATLPVGSDIIQTSNCMIGSPAVSNQAACDAATDVSGEFGYATSSTGFNGGTLGDYGVASSGYIDGSGSLINPNGNLDNPVSLDGINFGIVGSNYSAAQSNTGDTSVPLIQSAVKFTFTFTGTLTEAMIQNVGFVYGTAFNEVQVTTENVTTENIETTETVVPEPTTLALLGTGLLGAARGLRRRKRASSVAV